MIYVNHLLKSNSLQAAVEQIIANPHVLFTKERHMVRMEQARRIDSLTVKNICAVPRYFERIRPGSSLSVRPLSHSLQDTSLENHFPGSVLSSRMISILDNPENQFVLHVLESMLDAVGRVKLSPQCTLDIHTEAGRNTRGNRAPPRARPIQGGVKASPAQLVISSLTASCRLSRDAYISFRDDAPAYTFVVRRSQADP